MCCLGLGTIIIFCSERYLFFWLGLEIVSLGFLGVYSLEPLFSPLSAATYLIPNGAGNLVFLVGCLGGGSGDGWGGLRLFLSILGLLLKLGVFPLHFWILSLVSRMGRGCLFVFLGPLKIGPLLGSGVVLGGISGNEALFVGLAAAALMGAMEGVSIQDVRAVLAYSSILSGG